MQIIHVVLTLDPATGGPPIVATRLASAQARLGHQATLVSCASPHAAVAIAKMMSALPGADLVRRVDLPFPRHGRRLLAGAAGRQLPQIVKNADIVHLHGLWDPILRAAAAAAHDRNIPYVLAPHGMLDPWSLSQHRWRKWLALLLGYRAMLNHAAFLHVLNYDEANLIHPLELTVAAEVVPNGVFLEEIDPLPPAGTFRKAHPELGTDACILFLSRLHPKKGLDYLADAFAQLLQGGSAPLPRLVVAGPDDGLRGDFERQIRRLGIQDRVHLVGPLYGRDKLAAMIDASCFCLPSRQEGLSVAVLEALACGTPVLLSKECHFPEAAAHGAGLVVPLSAAAFADGLARILADPSAAAAMGRRGRELIERRFTWPMIAEAMIAAYARVVHPVPEVSRPMP